MANHHAQGVNPVPPNTSENAFSRNLWKTRLFFSISETFWRDEWLHLPALKTSQTPVRGQTNLSFIETLFHQYSQKATGDASGKSLGA